MEGPLFAGVVFAILAILGSPPLASIGAAGLIAVGATLAGSILGFLFGIPRARTALSKSTGSSRQMSYAPNTNLEEMSDWLTKIIIGVGLVQLGPIVDAFSKASESARVAMNLAPGGQLIAGALILSFVGIGFLATYLWARTSLAGTFALADEIQDRLYEVQSTADDARRQSDVSKAWQDKLSCRSFSSRSGCFVAYGRRPSAPRQ